MRGQARYKKKKKRKERGGDGDVRRTKNEKDKLKTDGRKKGIEMEERKRFRKR